MLQTVEVLPHHRREVRRAIDASVELFSIEWEAPRLHRALDLSPDGIRVAAGTRLPPGEPVLISFTPPGWWVLGPLTIFGEVVRETPRLDGSPATMALLFHDLPFGARTELARSLSGRPPPLPQRRLRTARDHVWIDMLTTYTEDLGDRTNTVEISELIASDLDDALEEWSAQGSLLTGGRGPRRWAHPIRKRSRRPAGTRSSGPPRRPVRAVRR